MCDIIFRGSDEQELIVNFKLDEEYVEPEGTLCWDNYHTWTFNSIKTNYDFTSFV